MDWNMVKWFAVLVGAGVVTALTVEFITKRMEDTAVMAARAEMGKLLVAAGQQQQTAQQRIPQQVSADNIVMPSEVPKPKEPTEFQGLMY